MILLPAPRRLDLTEGSLPLPPRGLIQFLGDPAEMLPAARAVQRALATSCRLHYPLVAGGPPDGVVIDLVLSRHLPHEQGYEIEIGPTNIQITAASPAAAFWAAQTLAQILRQCPAGALPCLQIEDRPDFRTRGVMLDVSRDKVPTMATLFELVDLFAELKLNHLQLYTEHTFAYRRHPDAWRDACPLTGEEILQLDEYCRARFIELTPNQNSFGHLECWLKLPAYRDLADAPDGYTSPWGIRHDVGATLNPLDPRSIALIADLYDELLPHFTSPMLNVGCDETFDLGIGRSRSECDRVGKGRVYLDFLLKIHALAQDHGRLMMFWGDIILHHPELIPQLPRDVVALEWGYEADHPFHDHLEKFAAAGIPVFVCPGTSSWCSLTGRTDNAIANLRRAAQAGIAHDAAGYLITDWGDYGHHHPLPISYLPYAAGAAFSWSYAANENLDLPAAVSGHLCVDGANVIGPVLADLGNVYQCCREPLPNGSRLFWALLGGPQYHDRFANVSSEEFTAAESRVGEILQRLSAARMTHPHANLIIDEIKFAGDLLRHACRRGRFLLARDNADFPEHLASELQHELQSLLDEHRRLWLSRNRSGGLTDSSSRLERAKIMYGKDQTLTPPRP